MLYIFRGLPGSGKSELSRHLAQQIGAVHLRIDVIEQALRDTGVEEIGPKGYVVAYKLALDNLRLGQSVIADSVNPIAITMESWNQVAIDAGAPYLNIEVICSDPGTHRLRVESRKSQVPGLKMPTWQEVVEREYHKSAADTIVIDTAGKTPEQSREELMEAIDHKLASRDR